MSTPATPVADSTPVTPIRYVRISDEDWTALQQSAGSGGRSSVLRRLLHLFATDPGLRARVDAAPDPVGDRNPTHPRTT